MAVWSLRSALSYICLVALVSLCDSGRICDLSHLRLLVRRKFTVAYATSHATFTHRYSQR